LLPNSILLHSSCKNRENNYEERIKNVITFLETDNGVNTDTCRNVFIVYTDKCGVCADESIRKILANIDEQNLPGVIFLLSAYNEQIFFQIFSRMNGRDWKIIFDEKRLFAKYGLSFMRNIFVEVCRKKVKSWKFYE